METATNAAMALHLAISAVMTDAQLDTPVPANGGATTRELLRRLTPTLHGMVDAVPARDGVVKAHWHPTGHVGARKFNAEWRPLVLGDETEVPAP